MQTLLKKLHTCRLNSLGQVKSCTIPVFRQIRNIKLFFQTSIMSPNWKWLMNTRELHAIGTSSCLHHLFQNEGQWLITMEGRTTSTQGPTFMPFPAYRHCLLWTFSNLSWQGTRKDNNKGIHCYTHQFCNKGNASWSSRWFNNSSFHRSTEKIHVLTWQMCPHLFR